MYSCESYLAECWMEEMIQHSSQQDGEGEGEGEDLHELDVLVWSKRGVRL